MINTTLTNVLFSKQVCQTRKIGKNSPLRSAVTEISKNDKTQKKWTLKKVQEGLESNQLKIVER